MCVRLTLTACESVIMYIWLDVCVSLFVFLFVSLPFPFVLPGTQSVCLSVSVWLYVGLAVYPCDNKYVYMFGRTYVCMSACLSVSICLSVCMPVCLLVYIYICAYMYICIYILFFFSLFQQAWHCLYIDFCLCLIVYLHLCLPANLCQLSLCIPSVVYAPMRRYLCVRLCIDQHCSLCVYLCVSLRVAVCVSGYRFALYITVSVLLCGARYFCLVAPCISASLPVHRYISAPACVSLLLSLSAYICPQDPRQP